VGPGDPPAQQRFRGSQITAVVRSRQAKISRSCSLSR
jgi:hypothetical protein